jgi:succinyl-CoA synthetase beta subunit
MLGTRLVTKQSGPAGMPVNQVYVEAGSEIERELYLSLLVDRSRERIAFIASAAGGMDIEEVAAKTPEQILTVAINPGAGLQPYQARQLGYGLCLNHEQVKQFVELATKLYRLFNECDASLIEINPLIVTKAGQLLSLDGKINIEDNALFRQRELQTMRDASQEDEMERRAAEHDLNYVSLDGNIACMVNGAGLAMATMDLIKLHGGEPANFLDVGGGATPERVAAAFKLILSNPGVKAILVNIFGGIVRCAPGRHQCRTGPGDAERQRPRHHSGRRPQRRSPQGCRRTGMTQTMIAPVGAPSGAIRDFQVMIAAVGAPSGAILLSRTMIAAEAAPTGRQSEQSA